MIENVFFNIKSFDLAQFFNFMPKVRFWIKDENSVFKWVNISFLGNYAMQDLSEVVGKSDYDLSPYYIAEQFVFDDRAFLQGKVVENRIELVSSVDIHKLVLY